MKSRFDSMKLFLTFLILCGCLWPAVLRSEEPAISVTASSSVRYQPDTAEFTTSVSATERDASRASAQVAVLWKSLQQALRSAGVAASDASSIAYSVNPEWEYNRTTGKRSLKGYTARHTVRVTVRDPGKLGGAIDAAAGAGASSVTGLKYSSSRFDHFRAEALTAAVKSARADAELMARAAGGRLGSVLELAYTAPRPDVPVLRSVMAANARADEATEVEPGEQELSVTVNSRWQFVSGGR